MLPSMPLISTPLKEPTSDMQRKDPVDVEIVEVPMTSIEYQGPNDDPTSSKDTTVDGTTKSLDARSHLSEQQTLRPIAPKPVMVVISTPAPPLGAVPHVNSTEILSTVPDGIQLPADNEPTKQTEACAEQHVKPQIELQVPEQKEESPCTEEKKIGEQPVERKDDEKELAALMLASTTIRSSPKSRSSNSAKKKTKHIRDIEATLNLLAPDSEDTKNEKAFGFAQAYFMKVTERLEGKDDILYQEFLKTMNDFGHTIFSVPELYYKITGMFHEHPDLAEEFLTFLLPEQAMECGKFMEHLMVTKMRDFFRLLEVYFAKQPQQMRKIYSGLSALSSQNNVTLQDVRTSILPLLKGNSLLVDSFLQLLPQERPPDSIVSEFEEMDDGDADTYNIGDEHFETVKVPDQKDMYGGDQCMCSCHETGDEKYQRRALHCVSCGTKFIYGRVFVQTGKVLRPAKVVFDVDRNRTIERLSAKERPKKCSRKRSVFRYTKDTTPTKSHGEEGRHDSETISPKSSRSCKSRTPTSSHKKVTLKSSSCKSSAGTSNVKTSMGHSGRVSNSVAVSKSRLEPPHNVPVKKPCLATKTAEKQSASSTLKEVPCTVDEFPSMNVDKDTLELRSDSQDSETAIFVRDPDLLAPECIITETEPPAAHENNSTRFTESTATEMPLNDFSSLSQIIRSKECDQCPTEIDMSEQPENLSCRTVPEDVSNEHVCGSELKTEACDLTLKTLVAESSASHGSSDNELKMEVDDVDENIPLQDFQASNHDKPIPKSWTRDEDKIILQMFQLECNAEQTFQKISQHLSQRSVNEIRDRFHTLMNLLEQMTGVKMEPEITN